MTFYFKGERSFSPVSRLQKSHIDGSEESGVVLVEDESTSSPGRRG